MSLKKEETLSKGMMGRPSCERMGNIFPILGIILIPEGHDIHTSLATIDT